MKNDSNRRNCAWRRTRVAHLSQLEIFTGPARYMPLGGSFRCCWILGIGAKLVSCELGGVPRERLILIVLIFGGSVLARWIETRLRAAENPNSQPRTFRLSSGARCGEMYARIPGRQSSGPPRRRRLNERGYRKCIGSAAEQARRLVGSGRSRRRYVGAGEGPQELTSEESM